MHYGLLLDTPEMANPSILWMPTYDTYADPYGNRLVAEEIITNGSDKHMNQFNRRQAGCDLKLMVTGNVDEAYPQLEALINRTANAIREIGNSNNNQNTYPVAGHYVDRSQLSENTVAYIMQIEVEVPLYYETPIYPLQSLAITINSESPQ